MTATSLEQLYRDHAGRLLGSLVRSTGDLGRAEEALHDAVEIALRRWPVDGVPRVPAAWLLTVARRRCIDLARRDRVRGDREDRGGRLLVDADPVDEFVELDHASLADDQLRLVFLCAHPALSPDAQVALTLRSVAGLTTAEIAAAHLVDDATMAQRLVRAQRKIRDAGIPFAMPEHLDERLDVVLRVVYLVFNEGYAASGGDELVRVDLCAEAIRLALTLEALLPDHTEVTGLASLMRLHHARRAARLDERGDLVLLDDQDRSRWDHLEIERAVAALDAAMARGRSGRYQVEAAIAALHCTSPHPDATDWPQIVALYRVLSRLTSSAVVELNAAVAIGMADGPEAGLAALSRITDDRVTASHLFLAARGDFFRRSGRSVDARSCYAAALAGCRSEPEQRFLRRRISELG
jgi:RNA polymerase sigma-70 factor (ECF subfamily)